MKRQTKKYFLPLLIAAAVIQGIFTLGCGSDSYNLGDNYVEVDGKTCYCDWTTHFYWCWNDTEGCTYNTYDPACWTPTLLRCTPWTTGTGGGGGTD